MSKQLIVAFILALGGHIANAHGTHQDSTATRLLSKVVEDIQGLSESNSKLDTRAIALESKTSSFSDLLAMQTGIFSAIVALLVLFGFGSAFLGISHRFKKMRKEIKSNSDSLRMSHIRLLTTEANVNRIAAHLHEGQKEYLEAVSFRLKSVSSYLEKTRLQEIEHETALQYCRSHMGTAATVLELALQEASLIPPGLLKEIKDILVAIGMDTRYDFLDEYMAVNRGISKLSGQSRMPF